MPEDLQVLKRIWDSKIPVRFQLAPEEIAREDCTPSPVYIHAPRVSYFPLIIDRVIRYFIEFTESRLPRCEKERESVRGDVVEAELSSNIAGSGGRSEKIIDDKTPVNSKLDCLPAFKVWLEHANQPLKWHYPIGLLFDLYADEVDLPWKLVVHFQGYPSDVLLSPPVHRRAVELHFMNMLKEADALKHRSQVMNQMQARDHRQLWTGLLNHQFDQYWNVNQKLMNPAYLPNEESHSATHSEVTGSDQSDVPDTDVPPKVAVSPSLKAFRLLPCRLYFVDKIRTSTTGCYIQRRLKPSSVYGVPLTLIEAMHQFLQPENEHEHDCSADPELRKLQFVLHGVCLPNEVPIQWLCEHLTYADNFLHIVARPHTHSVYPVHS